MIALALIFAAVPVSEAHAYLCKGSDNISQFVLSFQEKGNRVSDVRVYVEGTPRLSPDLATQWKGKKSARAVSFAYSASYTKGLLVGGSMELSPVADMRNQYELSWTEVFGLNSHVPMESGGKARCERKSS